MPVSFRTIVDAAKKKNHVKHEISRNGEPIGIGRVIHKSILQKLSWRPFDDTKTQGMDYCMYKRIEALNGKVEIINDDSLISISLSGDFHKTKHKFGATKGSLGFREIDPEVLINIMPEITKLKTELCQENVKSVC